MPSGVVVKIVKEMSRVEALVKPGGGAACSRRTSCCRVGVKLLDEDQPGHCEDLRSRVQKTVGSWRSGKFNPWGILVGMVQ